MKKEPVGARGILGVETILLCALVAAGGFLSGQETEGTALRAKTEAIDEMETGEDYIRWAEFNVTCEALEEAWEYDLNTYREKTHLNWVDLLAWFGAKHGGDFSGFEPGDLAEAAEEVKEKGVRTLTGELEYYGYYREVYDAVLGGMLGPHKIGGKAVYGLKAFHPIAKGFPYSDYDDFGVSRTYGYERNHLGHDMMGQIGTPVIAVESGYVAAEGWNQYGGWRLGINSFDGKRYYYYAHLRQDRPYAMGLKEGDVVQAGDVIGYMGRTGYSTTENVNNIDENHLHFGLQLIFDESQREGNNEIWVNCYELVRFLYRNQSEVKRDDATKEWSRVISMEDPAAQEYLKKQKK